MASACEAVALNIAQCTMSDIGKRLDADGIEATERPTDTANGLLVLRAIMVLPATHPDVLARVQVSIMLSQIVTLEIDSGHKFRSALLLGCG
jgi:hypothetical protein